MDEPITIETDLFEHREVKAHFINPCCFGEDFAAWLKERLSPLTSSGFSFSEIIQEDYGWGFRARRGKNTFWVAISYVGDGPQEAPPQWVISVASGLNPLKRLFHSLDREALKLLRDSVARTLASNMDIRIVPTRRYGS